MRAYQYLIYNPKQTITPSELDMLSLDGSEVLCFEDFNAIGAQIRSETILVLAWPVHTEPLQTELANALKALAKYQKIVVTFGTLERVTAQLLDWLNHRVIDKISLENYIGGPIAEELMASALELSTKFESDKEEMANEAKLLDELNENLRMRNELMEAEKEMASLFHNFETPLDQKLIAVLQQMAQFLEIEHFSLYLNHADPANANGEQLRLRLAHSSCAQIQPHDLSDQDEFSAIYTFYNQKHFTVDDYRTESRVSKNKYLPDSILTSHSFPIPVGDQVYAVAELYNKKESIGAKFPPYLQKIIQDMMSNLCLQLEIYTLQEQVLHSKNEIQDILNNVEQGIFTIGANGLINSEYSARTTTILATEQLHKQSATDLLFRGAIGKSDEVQNQHLAMREWIATVFDMPENWDMLRELGTKQLIRQIQQGEGLVEQHLLLKYLPISKNDRMEKLMFIVTDVTAEKVAQQALEAAKQEKESKERILREILKLDPHVFMDFLNESAVRVTELGIILDLYDDRSLHTMPIEYEETLHSLYSLVHDLKGVSNYVGLAGLAANFHALENQIRALSETKQFETFGELIGTIKTQMVAFTETINNLTDMLKSFNQQSFFSDWSKILESENMTDLFVQLRPHVPSTLAMRLANHLRLNEKRIELFKKSTFNKYRKRFLTSAMKLAQKQEKEITVVCNFDYHAPLKAVRLLEDLLIPLVINSVDHGIEPKHERQMQGKAPVGTLRVVLRYHPEQREVSLILADDGRGIDFARVRTKAIAKALLTPAQAADISEQALLDLLFLPQFSTQDVATQTSGRGLGLDIVKTKVEKLGGRIEVKSTRGQGTAFELRWGVGPTDRAVQNAAAPTGGPLSDL